MAKLEAQSGYAEVWKTLSAIDVSEHTEKKNGLTYLSWAWAWGVLMKHYPEAIYEFPAQEVHLDGTVTVHCNVHIGNCVRSMWLPVMDYKNIAIKNPDARKISDTKMRCLVKNLVRRTMVIGKISCSSVHVINCERKSCRSSMAEFYRP